MNFLHAEAEIYLKELGSYLDRNPENLINLFLVPPFTVLRSVCELVRGLPIQIGAQNMHWEEKGSFTGEISSPMVKDCGAHIIELGHSERRAMFGETDSTVNKKVHAALAHGLKPLLCVGESAMEKQFGVSPESVIRQVKIALYGVPRDQVGKVLIAYEPVWAIGEKGTSAQPSYANSIHVAIRRAVEQLYDRDSSHHIPILYGGSVDLQNAESLLREPDIDGLFVGRAAWNPQGFIRLVEIGRDVSRLKYGQL